MTAIRARLFGRFQVSTASGPVEGLEAHKVQELFSYLLLSDDKPVLREQLADQLWPNVDGKRAKKYLRQALWQMQKVLARISAADSPVFRVGSEWVERNVDAEIRVDALDFMRAHDRALNSPDGELTPDLRADLIEAVEAYRGRLLEGWYHDWCLQVQDTYRSMYLTVLDRLMSDAEATERWESGLAYGRRALEEDRANERIHARMMRLHCMAGNRTEALRQFESCMAILRDELEVAPEPGTVQLYHQIRDGGRLDTAGSDGRHGGWERVDTGNPGPHGFVLSYLQRLSSTLDQLRDEITGQIHQLERG